MKRVLLLCVLVSALCGLVAAEEPNAKTVREVLALERQTMEGWLAGNPDPTLAVLDPEVTYFHFPLMTRLDGLPAVKTLFEPYRGKPLFDSYDMLDPKVQVSGDVAVLTYQLVTRNGSTTSRWNSTEVYQHKKEGWRVIHAHWSKANAPQPTSQP
jgi:ketosteroid isomerase-like protein